MLKIQTAAWYAGLLIGAGTFIWTILVLVHAPIGAPISALGPSHKVGQFSVALISAVAATPTTNAPVFDDPLSILSSSFSHIVGYTVLSTALLLIGYQRFNHHKK